DAQEPIVERKDPKKPPRVELAKVSIPALGIVEDPGDQEPGKDKEQIHSRPPRLAQGGDDSIHRHGRPEAAPEDRVKDDHEGNCYAANAIQGREAGAGMQRLRRPAPRRAGAVRGEPASDVRRRRERWPYSKSMASRP